MNRTAALSPGAAPADGEGMTALPHTVVRTAHRLVPAWWVLAAWASLLLVVVAGLAAAAGLY